MIKWALVFVIGGFFAITGWQLVPVYFNNHLLGNIVADIVAEDTLRKRPKRELIQAIDGQFKNNNLGHLETSEVVKVGRDPSGTLIVDVKYEERRKLLYNLEIVAGFDEQFTN